MKTNKDSKHLLKPNVWRANHSITILMDFFYPKKIIDSIQDKAFQHYQKNGTNETFTDSNLDIKSLLGNYDNELLKLEALIRIVLTSNHNSKSLNQLKASCELVESFSIEHDNPDKYCERIKLEGVECIENSVNETFSLALNKIISDNSNRTKPKEAYFMQYGQLLDELRKKFLDIADKQITKSLPSKFKEIFIDADYEKYMNPLCTMDNPLLLKVDNKYRLIRGKGAICEFFYKKLKPYMHRQIGQDEISNVLVNEIDKFGERP